VKVWVFPGIDLSQALGKFKLLLPPRRPKKRHLRSFPAFFDATSSRLIAAPPVTGSFPNHSTDPAISPPVSGLVDDRRQPLACDHQGAALEDWPGYGQSGFWCWSARRPIRRSAASWTTASSNSSQGKAKGSQEISPDGNVKEVEDCATPRSTPTTSSVRIRPGRRFSRTVTRSK